MTRYGVQRQSDGAWWGVTAPWVRNPCVARWFGSATEATTAGLRELSHGTVAWEVQPIDLEHERAARQRVG